jgi:hypothetical protein
MYSDPASRMPRKHANGWMTVLALGFLVLGLLGCLYILVGNSAEAQVTGSTADLPSAPAPQTQAPVTAPSAPAASSPARSFSVPAQPLATGERPLRRRLQPRYLPPATVPELPPAPSADSVHTDIVNAEVEAELNTVRDQLKEAREAQQKADQSQHRARNASAIFLAVFAVIAALIVIQVYVQARGWDSETTRASEEIAALRTQLEGLRTGGDAHGALPALLQEVGEQPLSYEEEGTAFTPKALGTIADIDHLAYVGQGRVAFREIPSQSDAAVYLNGLLLSAVAHVSQSDPWTAFARLDLFFSQLSRFPDAVERLRIAQGYSYRALAAYQVLEAQDKEPSWMRRGGRAQLEALCRQAFTDVAHASSADPEWKHSTYVEALLCSRFYLAEEAVDNSSRNELLVRGLRRSVSLYKGLIDGRSYRGPSRRNLIRCLKQIAELTGEKSDFSEFGYALNAFPNDEELADEALAARQPNSQDRFLWQWMLGDEDLFARVHRLNLAEYRAFWIRMLDNKVHLRNWRSDLSELQKTKPAMKEWTIQLLHAESPLSLSSAISRRLERYDTSASG